MALEWIAFDDAHSLGVCVARVLPGTALYTRAVEFRIDGRGEGYRVDVHRPLAPTWEAIDGGVPFETYTAAVAAVDRWVAKSE